jgi:hypothetical protein
MVELSLSIDGDDQDRSSGKASDKFKNVNDMGINEYLKTMRDQGYNI